jgi:hypothetical protein
MKSTDKITSEYLVSSFCKLLLTEYVAYFEDEESANMYSHIWELWDSVASIT